MNKKETVNLITNISLIILAGCILLLPTFKITDLKTILLVTFGFYTLINLTSFILLLKEHDYENLFTSIISLAGLIATYFLKIIPKTLTLIILLWVGCMSLVKLKKADFYHDHKSKMWIIRVFILLIFLTSGLLTGLNIKQDEVLNIIVIGSFFLINGILDTFDPLVSYLTGGRK